MVLGCHGYGIRYGAERRYRASVEHAFVPDVRSGLVGRLPRNRRFATSQTLGRRSVVAAGEIVRVKDATSMSRTACGRNLPHTAVPRQDREERLPYSCVR